MNPGNTYRDIMRVGAKRVMLPKPREFLISMIDPATHEVVQKFHPFVMPSDLFKALKEHLTPAEFDSMFGRHKLALAGTI